jgi:hypothetical protein
MGRTLIRGSLGLRVRMWSDSRVYLLQSLQITSRICSLSRIFRATKSTNQKETNAWKDQVGVLPHTDCTPGVWEVFVSCCLTLEEAVLAEMFTPKTTLSTKCANIHNLRNYTFWKAKNQYSHNFFVNIITYRGLGNYKVRNIIQHFHSSVV